MLNRGAGPKSHFTVKSRSLAGFGSRKSVLVFNKNSRPTYTIRQNRKISLKNSEN